MDEKRYRYSFDVLDAVTNCKNRRDSFHGTEEMFNRFRDEMKRQRFELVEVTREEWQPVK